MTWRDDPRVLALASFLAFACAIALSFTVLAAPPVRSAASPKAAPAIVTIYRFYNKITGVHFYTADPAERQLVLNQYPNFVDEGAAYNALASADTGSVTVYRFYNTQTGAHFYTADPTERQRVISTMPQFVDEGARFYAYANDALDHLPVHRFYNTRTQTHFYTASETERAYVVSHYPAFVYEGIAWYALPLGGGADVAAKRDAFRLLDQATFGPTPVDVAHVMQIGAAAWIDEQFAQPVSGYPDSMFNYLSLDESDSCKFSAPRGSPQYDCAQNQLTLFQFRNRFFQNALTGKDQLRQRVAWALSQIFVISGMKDPDMETAYVQARYHQMLAEEAFDNVQTLLTRMTLSPAMGHMLDMVDNAKADPQAMTEPNENFGRELLQLFSIGVRELKPDGTLLLDANGAPIPTYGQDEVRAFARALTGWTYAKYDAAQAKGDDDNRYYAKPMVSVPANHDMNSKKLLYGIELPAGQTTEADLAATLNNVFLHPNVGPFLGSQLIHQLVTSNPGPDYVARVTAAFENNGQGVRGDMKAVLRAILLDPEARTIPAGTPNAASYGRFKEPALYVTGVLRSLGAGSDGIGLADYVKSMGQDPFYAPTVFNYFPADYKVPGTDLIAPPMGIHNTNTVLARSNFASQILYNGGLDPSDDVPGSVGTSLDITAYKALATDSKQLLTAIDDRLFGGGMPFNVKNTIYLALESMDAGDTEARARAALYLAATAFQYQVSQ